MNTRIIASVFPSSQWMLYVDWWLHEASSISAIENATPEDLPGPMMKSNAGNQAVYEVKHSTCSGAALARLPSLPSAYTARPGERDHPNLRTDASNHDLRGQEWLTDVGGLDEWESPVGWKLELGGIMARHMHAFFFTEFRIDRTVCMSSMRS